jgi:thymidylate synthase (FAD)
VQDQTRLINEIQRLQKKWRDLGAAKEVVRVIMPEGLTMSNMYVNFNIRSLMHYIDVRSGNGTQLEHQDVALKALEVVKPLFPNSFEYFGGKYE